VLFLIGKAGGTPTKSNMGVGGGSLLVRVVV